MKAQSHLACVGLLLVLVASGFAQAGPDPLADTVMLIATPELKGGYARTVLVAKRLAQEWHMGVIINRPTRTSLATLFPDHAPSKKIVDPVHFGGPVAVDTLSAMVRSKEQPGEGALQFASDLFFVIEADTIDRIIEQQPDHARFYVGIVLWRPGELAAEVARGLWVTEPADPDLVLRKHTEGMWDELIRRVPRARANVASAH
jgi:putative transcriptional regulator